MAGASLWLLPPADHPLHSVLTELIKKVSAHFHSPHLFLPHVTLTSDISPSSYASDPHKWLEEVEFPPGTEVKVEFRRLQSEDVFVRKLYIKVEKTGVSDIGRAARKMVEGFEDGEAANQCAEEKYAPHLSLLYHDCPRVDDDEIAKIEQLVQEAGVSLAGEGELGGWVGGRVVLVPTDRPIKEWAPLTEKKL
ncbi:2',3'-cyclic-nucleotide 3'-phosphodiesteras-like protein [Massariosphaeria phaeospora]|uniref:2',3'-cyclic-nucleotide 3'-phosphodiesteras-like protein n=1 Tax=Massariosphaeria phaeospora TaxID=100035 RepID=A0A7C8M6C9_9PLEO|nr:2',3'-cyclic-nucleotide 3'-phosphodiesteras-like protein [Massariosphaeria phaeospora]